jgi:hypothetical protein
MAAAGAWIFRVTVDPCTGAQIRDGIIRGWQLAIIGAP